jgi:hypothetical protein
MKKIILLVVVLSVLFVAGCSSRSYINVYTLDISMTCTVTQEPFARNYNLNYVLKNMKSKNELVNIKGAVYVFMFDRYEAYNININNVNIPSSSTIVVNDSLSTIGLINSVILTITANGIEIDTFVKNFY